MGDLREGFRRLGFFIHLADHAAAIGGISEQLCVEWNDRDRLDFQRLEEVRRRDFRTFGHADLIENEMRQFVVGSQFDQRVEEILRIAQICEIGNRRNDHLVGFRKDCPGPVAPLVWKIENRNGRTALQNLEDRQKCLTIEIIGPVEKRRCREQRQMIGTFG
ncbi:hypothetical protein D3C78_1431210 [compost metagenome]